MGRRAGPGGTPPAVTELLSRHIGQALGSAELARFLRERGAEPMPTTPQATGQFIAAEVQKWGDAVRRSGAQVD